MHPRAAAVPYQAILFDFDGVLVDTEPLHFACWRDILRLFGVELDWDTYNVRCRGVADHDMIGALCALRSPPAPFEAVWAEYPAKKQRFRALAAANDLVSDAVRSLLEELAGYRLAVVSSSARAEVEPILARGGIHRCFGALVFGEDVERLKPAPDPYRKAADLLGAASALVVEDSQSGLASGRAAGFNTLFIPRVEDMPRLVRQRLLLA